MVALKSKFHASPEPTVYVVDDDLTARILLERILSAANYRVETYTSAEEFLASYSKNICGCLLLDIMMPGMDGLELQEVLTAQGNRTPVVFLSASSEIKNAVRALKSGALDFLGKPIEPQAVLKCVGNAMELDQRHRFEELQRLHIEQRTKTLTSREYEVMNWIVRGKSNKMIARILDISTRTVEVHRRKVMEKMQVNSVADLVQMILVLQKF